MTGGIGLAEHHVVGARLARDHGVMPTAEPPCAGDAAGLKPRQRRLERVRSRKVRTVRAGTGTSSGRPSRSRAAPDSCTPRRSPHAARSGRLVGLTRGNSTAAAENVCSASGKPPAASARPPRGERRRGGEPVGGLVHRQVDDVLFGQIGGNSLVSWRAVPGGGALSI